MDIEDIVLSGLEVILDDCEFFFFFLREREFQPMVFAPDDSYLLSD